MENENQRLVILMAEDDPDDRHLTKRAMEKAKVLNRLDFVEDGEELMDYLNRRNKYAHLASEPLPGILLLDLNMPRKDGRQALKEIKKDPTLCKIPVVVLTTSDDEADILASYKSGASSYIRKPVTLDGLVNTMAKLGEYWFEIVKLPR